MARHVYMKTFGCQMNRYDSDRMLEMLSAEGYESTNDPDRADLVIVNTCSVRAKPEKKVLNFLGRFAAQKARGRRVVLVVSGCVAEQHGERLLNEQPLLDIVLGPDHVHDLPGLVERAGDGERLCAVGEAAGPAFLKAMPLADKARVSEIVTIAKGCDNFCSYCIVPFVRGTERSRPVEEVVSEAKRLVQAGAKEIVLIGQNVNSYKGKGGFPALLEMVASIDGLERLRFTTSHPKDFDENLARCFKDIGVLCEWLHLPFQAGSDRVLKEMNRGYTRSEYLEKVAMYRDFAPGGSIGADCIVGFPGETDHDFEQTLKIVEEVGFDQLFSFKYSPRPGTAAYDMHDDVPADIKALRLRQLQSFHASISASKNRAMVGSRVQVLVEGFSSRGGQLMGRTRSNKVVNFPGAEDLIGSVVTVQIEEGLANSLRGRLVQDPA